MTDARTPPLPDWARGRLGDRRASRGAVKVIHALEAHPREASYGSAADVADLAGVNVATVVRTAQLLDFTGWPTLRRELRSRYLASLSATEVLSEHLSQASDSTREAIRRDVENLQELSRTIDPTRVTAIARVLTTARTTLVLGSGSFAAPGLQLSHLAQTMGYDVRLQREGGTALLGSAALLGPADALVLFRLWRSPTELVAAARVAHEQGSRVVCISDRQVEELSEVSTEMLIVPSEGVSFFPTLAAAMTVVHAVLAEMVNQDESRARAASDRAESLWGRFGLFGEN